MGVEFDEPKKDPSPTLIISDLRLLVAITYCTACIHLSVEQSVWGKCALYKELGDWPCVEDEEGTVQACAERRITL